MDSNTSRYETRDLNAKYVLYFAIGLVVSSILIHIVTWWLFEIFVTRQTRSGYTPTRIVSERVPPPEPRLQINPATDYATMLEQAMQHLTTYGWVDRQNGTARIPIERAMDIIAEQGLPVRAEGNR